MSIDPKMDPFSIGGIDSWVSTLVSTNRWLPPEKWANYNQMWIKSKQVKIGETMCL